METQLRTIKWIPIEKHPSTMKGEVNKRLGKSVKVLLWYLRAEEDDEFNSTPRCVFGHYYHSCKEWRPIGCNGNFNDSITHWAAVPSGPS